MTSSFHRPHTAMLHLEVRAMGRRHSLHPWEVIAGSRCRPSLPQVPSMAALYSFKNSPFDRRHTQLHFQYIYIRIRYDECRQDDRRIESLDGSGGLPFCPAPTWQHSHSSRVFVCMAHCPHVPPLYLMPADRYFSTTPPALILCSII